MINAGVEPDVVLHHLIERRPFVIDCQPPIATPVKGHRAAAVRDDQLQAREILEQIAHDELHERGGVGIDVVGAGAVKAGIARGADVHHRRHVKLHQLLIKLVPPPIGQRRRRPIATRGIGIEIAADKTELLHAALQLADAAVRRHTRRLRQLAHADEVVRIERADTMDHLVAQLRPGEAHVIVADVMAHPHRARREDGEIGAALALKLELCAFDALADFVVGSLERGLGGLFCRVFQIVHLLLAPSQQVFRLGRVVAVAIDDHGTVRCCSDWGARLRRRSQSPLPR